jgi:hypothetical protein
MSKKNYLYIGILIGGVIGILFGAIGVFVQMPSHFETENQSPQVQAPTETQVSTEEVLLETELSNKQEAQDTIDSELVPTPQPTPVGDDGLNIDYYHEEYRDANFYIQKGYEIPEIKWNILKSFVDSMHEIKPDFRINEGTIELNVYYIGNEALHIKYLGETCYACYANNKIYISPAFMERPDLNGFAIGLVHEYVHLVQYNTPPEYVERYAEMVGWLWYGGDIYIPPFPYENEDFYKVVSRYAFYNPVEDMAEAYAYFYICDYDVSSLSEDRYIFAEDFWDGTQEEVCMNFE